MGPWSRGARFWVASAGGNFGPDGPLQPRKPAGLVTLAQLTRFLKPPSQKLQPCFLHYKARTPTPSTLLRVAAVDAF